MIRPGEEWGGPAESPADLEVAGSDAALAQTVAGARGALIRFRADTTSDVARAVGLHPGEPVGTEVPVDALALDGPALDGGTLAVNMCVFGTPPDRLRWWSPAPEIEIRLDGSPWFAGRATTVVVATGQFLRGLDVVPRGHPGDGRAEIQVYELGRTERRLMRARLATGAHVPHPRIRQRSAHTIALRAADAVPCEADGVALVAVSERSIEVVPAAYRLLI